MYIADINRLNVIELGIKDTEHERSDCDLVGSYIW